MEQLNCLKEANAYLTQELNIFKALHMNSQRLKEQVNIIKAIELNSQTLLEELQKMEQQKQLRVSSDLGYIFST